MDERTLREFARSAAWADSGHTDIDFGGETPVGMPDGWPEGVDAEQYFRTYAAKYSPNRLTPEPSVPSGPLVDRFRRMIDNA